MDAATIIGCLSSQRFHPSGVATLRCSDRKIDALRFRPGLHQRKSSVDPARGGAFVWTSSSSVGGRTVRKEGRYTPRASQTEAGDGRECAWESQGPGRYVVVAFSPTDPKSTSAALPQTDAHRLLHWLRRDRTPRSLTLYTMAPVPRVTQRFSSQWRHRSAHSMVEGRPADLRIADFGAVARRFRISTSALHSPVEQSWLRNTCHRAPNLWWSCCTSVASTRRRRTRSAGTQPIRRAVVGADLTDGRDRADSLFALCAFLQA